MVGDIQVLADLLTSRYTSNRGIQPFCDDLERREAVDFADRYIGDSDNTISTDLCLSGSRISLSEGS